jgi:hypothetical protein
MAEEDTSPPSSPVANASDGVLRPPPLTAFCEEDESLKSNLTFSLKISEKLTGKNFHMW